MLFRFDRLARRLGGVRRGAGPDRRARRRAALEALEPRALLVGGLIPGSVVDVSQETLNQSETAVAINPTNPLNVVIMANENERNGEFIGVSNDGGQTFSRRTFGDGVDGLPANGG